MSIDPRALEALKTPTPLEALRQYVRQLQTQGQTDAQILERLEQLRADLREEGRDAEEDVVLEVMDFVAGWCSPHVSLRRDEN
jgi:hypothetical protein